MVDLGNIYFKTGQLSWRNKPSRMRLRTFKTTIPRYADWAKCSPRPAMSRAAIENYKRAQEITPMPDYAAALYDLYQQSGQRALAVQANGSAGNAG